MGTHLALATHMLFSPEGLMATNVKLFPGKNRDATVDQMAEQLYKAIVQIEAGEFELVESFEDD